MSIKYIPIFRARQQENSVIQSFDFGNNIIPLIEIVKEKDRSNNRLSSIQIYHSIFNNINSSKIIIDLPIHFNLLANTAQEVISFYNSMIISLDARIGFYNSFNDLSDKIIPVISSLMFKTGEVNSITRQFEHLSTNFSTIVFRVLYNEYNSVIDEISPIIRENDIIILDLDSSPITNPIVRMNSTSINANFSNNVKVLARSAINSDIQNTKLQNGQIIGEADNSLLEYYSNPYNYQAFSDYAGIKKDEISAGGTISPGFIFYEPINNVYYGYKGNLKSLSEFENTIVPEVLNSSLVERIRNERPEFLLNNPGFETLLRIDRGEESGRSQPKFKRIAMEHYLHCLKIKIEADEL